MAYVGGKRQRLIKDNFARDIEAGLTTLGWFDAGRNHQPVKVISDQLDPAVEIKPNIVGITIEDIHPQEIEMGSYLEESTISSFIDIFAEGNSVGQHLVGDVFDLLRGKFTSIKDNPLLPILDLGQPDLPLLFNCYYENFEIQKNRSWSSSYNQHWWTIGVDIIDYYMDDTDINTDN